MQYNRVMLGKGGVYAKECRMGGFIGADFDIYEDLTGSLFENWRDFNKKYIPVWMANCPDKSKSAAGLACGFLWTIVKGLKDGDVVLCPSGEGYYYVGTICGDYYYVPGTSLPHRRKVNWLDKTIARNDMSKELKNSSGSIGTCCDLTRYADEIQALISAAPVVAPVPPTTPVAAPKNFDERSLHKLFCSSLHNKDIYAKTIFHEKTPNKVDHTQKWVHPDIVGVRFEDYNDATISLLKATEPKAMAHIYSFEMKRRIDSDSQLKQYFFQAVSNSSWANFGYLVAFEIADGLDEEMERLNNAFGIGVILMQAKEYTVLYPAREKSLDYITIQKLTNMNPDFKEFITKLSKVMNASKDYTSDARTTFANCCDKTFNSDEEVENYCKDKNIPF
jgi:hypothetical protein